MLYLFATILAPIAVLILLQRKQWPAPSRIWPAMVVMVGIMIASEIANGVWPSLLLFVSGLALFSLPVLLANNFIDRVKPQEDPKKINPVIDICFAACIVGAIGVYHYQATPSCFSEGLITEDMTIREVEELCSENKN